MSTATRIEWTRGDDGSAGATWNPVTGCDRISPGCQHCYALTLAKRLQAMGQAKYQADGRPPTSGPGFGVTIHPQALGEPLRWRRPRRIFVCSMADLFHARVPDAFIARVFAVMVATPQHTYQVLTKRPGRMARLLATDAFGDQVFHNAAAYGVAVLTWPLPNVWLGTSVEDQQRADQRIPKLLAAPATIRFLSCEPLLGPIDLTPWLACHCPDGPASMPVGCAECAHPANLRLGPEHATPLDWIIAGGESGPGHRPVDPGWVRRLRDQAVAAGVAFFFKQWGGRTPKAGGRLLDGCTWDQYPRRHEGDAGPGQGSR
jgi:protein gp37